MIFSIFNIGNFSRFINTYEKGNIIIVGKYSMSRSKKKKDLDYSGKMSWMGNLESQLGLEMRDNRWK